MASSCVAAYHVMLNLDKHFPCLQGEKSYELHISFSNSPCIPYIVAGSGKRYAFKLGENFQSIPELYDNLKASLSIIDDDVVSVKVIFHEDEILNIIVERALLNVEGFIEKLKSYQLEEFV